MIGTRRNSSLEHCPLPSWRKFIGKIWDLHAYFSWNQHLFTKTHAWPFHLSYLREIRIRIGPQHILNNKSETSLCDACGTRKHCANDQHWTYFMILFNLSGHPSNRQLTINTDYLFRENNKIVCFMSLSFAWNSNKAIYNVFYSEMFLPQSNKRFPTFLYHSRLDNRNWKAVTWTIHIWTPSPSKNSVFTLLLKTSSCKKSNVLLEPQLAIETPCETHENRRLSVD